MTQTEVDTRGDELDRTTRAQLALGLSLMGVGLLLMLLAWLLRRLS